MGWYRIYDGKHASPGETKEIEVAGDQPVDICDHCISHLILLWEVEFERLPTEKELQTAWNQALEATVKNGHTKDIE